MRAISRSSVGSVNLWRSMATCALQHAQGAVLTAALSVPEIPLRRWSEAAKSSPRLVELVRLGDGVGGVGADVLWRDDGQ